jgi:hypothetical protein
MSDQALGDIQQAIDKLFAKLDAAQSGGEISQANHALRVQITKKLKLGARLSAREQELVAAVGAVKEGKKSGGFGTLVLIVVVIGAIYLAWRFLSGKA